jgi:hypothetical protein
MKINAYRQKPKALVSFNGKPVSRNGLLKNRKFTQEWLLAESILYNPDFRSFFLFTDGFPLWMPG